jgi:hypothetical protein
VTSPRFPMISASRHCSVGHLSTEHANAVACDVDSRRAEANHSALSGHFSQLKLKAIAGAVMAVFAVSGVQKLTAQPVSSAARLGVSVVAGASIGAIVNRSSIDEMPHGAIGAASGAIAGAALGYLYVAMHCEQGISCNATRGMLTGAAAGAIVGVIIEYFVRNGQR